MSEYVLELKGITKIFPGVRALDKVQFQLKPGEIHALMGENGAGKSTFIKVITGVHQAEEGEIFLDGRKVTFRSPLDAQKAGEDDLHGYQGGHHRQVVGCEQFALGRRGLGGVLGFVGTLHFAFLLKIPPRRAGV